MKRYRDASFPPHGDWDQRLHQVACPGLAPVRLLHENPWYSVRDRGGYFTVEYHLPQVIVLPIVEERAVVMVRVLRPVLGDTTLELPAGCSEANETPHKGAARELAEETGIRIDSRRLVPMPPLAESPNRIPKLLYVFRIDLDQAEFDARAPHDEEVEAVELVSLDHAVRKITSGAIYAAIPVAVLGSYLLALWCRAS